MKVLIIEDEPAAARHLMRIITTLEPEIEVVEIIESVAGAVGYLNNKPQLDLVFSDIQLADGQSFEIFNQIDLSIPIVFTTAFDEFAIKAFKHNSIDYILKPYKESDLQFALDKYKKTKNVALKSPQEFSELFQFLRNAPKFKERFLFTLGQRLVPVEAASIARFEAREKAIYAKTIDNHEYLTDVSLDVLEAELDPNMFFRISRQLLVNRGAIQGISKYFSGRLKLDIAPEYKDIATVSRERVNEFREWLGG